MYLGVCMYLGMYDSNRKIQKIDYYMGGLRAVARSENPEGLVVLLGQKLKGGGLKPPQAPRLRRP